jgi:hypothetical protein
MAERCPAQISANSSTDSAAPDAEPMVLIPPGAAWSR